MRKPVTLSVVVCTKNSEATLKQCLNSIFGSSIHPFEVIIVDGMSSDKTIEIAKQYPVKIYYDYGKGIGFARRIGVEKAQGTFIAMIDSDSWIPLRWFESMLENFEKDPRLGGIEDECPSCNLDALIPKLEFYVRQLRRKREKEIQTKVDGRCYIGTSNSVWSRKAIIEAGNFDPNFHVCEDLDLSYRVWKRGYRLKIDTEITSYHSFLTTWLKLFKQQFWWGFYYKMAHKKYREFEGQTRRYLAGQFGVLYAFMRCLTYLRHIQEYYEKTNDRVALLTPIYYIIRTLFWASGFLAGSFARAPSNFH